MNKLITIGPIGIRVAYLNLSVEDAKKRYLLDNPEFIGDKLYVDEFEFVDEFCVYDAWAKSK